MQLERRLRTRCGGLLLVGPQPFVQQVFAMTGLAAQLRQAATLDEARAVARAGAGVQTAREQVNGRACTVLRQPGTSRVEVWGGDPATQPVADALIAVPIQDVGLSIGTAGFGETRRQALAGLGEFVGAGVFAGIRPAGEREAEFMLAGRHGEGLVHVAAAAGMTGVPPIAFRTEEPVPGESLADLLEVAGALVPDAGPAVGVAALAAVPGEARLALIVGLWGDAHALAGRGGEALRFARWLEGQPAVAGRTFAGRVVWLDGQPPGDLAGDPLEVLRPMAHFEALADTGSADPAMTVASATVWLFTAAGLTDGADRLLAIERDPGLTWREEWDIIARRLYRDSRRIVLSPLSGGYSAVTWRVASYDADGRQMLPTVLKIASREATSREEHAGRAYVDKFIHNNSTQILGGASAGEWAGLRYNFLGIGGPDSTLVWAREVYLTHPIEEFLRLLETLVTRILKPWYGQPRFEALTLFADHDPKELFPRLCDDAAAQLGIDVQADTLPCPELGIDLPNPFLFLDRDCARRRREEHPGYTAICHGDLNLQNILVDEGHNLYVIDFSETRPRSAVSDFARLEPIVKLELTRLESETDLARLVRFEEGLTSVSALGETPPFHYDGDDPMVEKAYRTVCRLRSYARTVSLFETSMLPYWLAVLEWTYSIQSYTSASVLRKRLAAYSAALIVRAIEQAGDRRG
jgi:hypothetical protein